MSASPNRMTDIYDGDIWSKVFLPNMQAAANSVNEQKADVVRIGLSVSFDGITLQREKLSKGNISIWPCVLTILNLPPWIRYSLSSLLLTFVPPVKVKRCIVI